MAVFDTVIAVAMAGVLLRHGVIVGAALWQALGQRAWPAPSAEVPLAVVIPAFNEAKVIEATVRAALRTSWTDLRVVVVDDGSTDGTGDVVARIAAEEPRVRLLRLPHNQGKAAALNAGIAEAGTACVVTCDADTLLLPDTVPLLVAPMLADPAVDAVASNVRVGNRGPWLLEAQSLEYVSGLQVERRAQAAVGCITTIPGAAGGFRVSALQAVGGYRGITVVEDTDLTLELLRAGRQVVFEPRAVAHTEAPDGWGGLLGQRTRWLTGYHQCLWLHRGAFVRPGVLGWLGMPNLLFVHVLSYALFPLSLAFLPRVPEVMEWGTFGALVGAFFGADLLLTAWAVWLDGGDLRALRHAPLQRLVWPFFFWVVFARVLWRHATGRTRIWDKVGRRGRLAAASLGRPSPD